MTGLTVRCPSTLMPAILPATTEEDAWLSLVYADLKAKGYLLRITK